MSKIISFAYTTPALLAGAKSCTRREWDDAYAAQFHKGDVVQAWNKSPRFKGEHVADIVLTADPVKEPIAAMPDSDFDAEGFRWLNAHPEAVDTRRFGTFSWEDFVAWRESGLEMWVVRFESVAVVYTVSGLPLARSEPR